MGILVIIQPSTVRSLPHASLGVGKWAIELPQGLD